MTVREIVTYPDDRLRSKAEPVAAIDDEILRLIDDMAETMYVAPGVGLAANQVGVLKRVVVIDVEYSEGPPRLLALINPKIVFRDGEATREEGCLSLPGVNEDISRSERVRVRALDREGNEVEIEGDGLLAAALQHEIDHLDGMVLIDHVSFLKRRMLHRNLKKKEADKLTK
jgi:peptide deformylase